MSSTAAEAFVESSLAAPPSKRHKVVVAAVLKEEEEVQEEDENEQQQDEEELTFTACQLLCGNLDSSLLLPEEESSTTTTTTTRRKSKDEDNDNDNSNDKGDDGGATMGQRRARAVLDLLSPFTTTTTTTTTTTRSSDDEKHEKRNKQTSWSLDLVRSHVQAFDAINNKNNPAMQLQALLAGSCCSHNNDDDDSIYPPPIWKLVQAAILSNAHVQIANHCIDQALGGSVKQQLQPKDGVEQQALCLLSWQDANHSLLLALEAWPCNPSALLTLANLQRMGRHHGNNNHGDDHSRGRLEYALNLYLAAAKCAYITQTASIRLLEDNHDDGIISISDDDKFLVESILLRTSAQYDVDDDDDDNEEEEEATSDDDDDNNEDEENEKKARPPLGENEKSPQSKALVIATYMSAMLASCLGKHELAAHVLRRFCGPNNDTSSSTITRIHPRVWEAAAGAATGAASSSSIARESEEEESSFNNALKTKIPTTTPKAAAFTPCLFPNAISQELLDMLRFAFRPNAPYWTQSQYERNVYYSFWTDWPLPQPSDGASSSSCTNNNNHQHQQYIVSNAIEHYIVTCLLPRVQSVGVDVQSNLKGFEWWVHTRPQGANLGHQLHFDTDEALLDQDTILDVPLTASVTYLTVDDNENDDDDSNHQFGATILFDQTPQSNENAQVAWISKPKSKAFVAFPGDLLHGVLPCNIMSSKNVASSKKKDAKNMHDTSGNIQDDDAAAPPTPCLHRLTFMVNFWACSIPDRLKERKLYGPSGPFPPRTAQHSWVEDIMGEAHGYPRAVDLPSTAIAPLSLDNDDDTDRSTSFMAVSPAWETIHMMTNATAAATGTAASSSSIQQPHAVDNPEWWDVSSACHSLDLPPDGGGIHQRFFVKNAPDYFRGTLYEK